MAAIPSRRRRGGRLRIPGDRYSRRVALLKRVLPAIAVTLLLLVAAWPRLSPLIAIHLPGIDLREARELKMVDPRYAGVDRLNRPYIVTAATGRQMPDRSDLLALDQPRATMSLNHGATITVSAKTGVYQAQGQLLDLTHEVTVTHQDGTRFVTASAHVDFAHNSAEGHEPVTGNGPAGDITAQGFRILGRGDTVIFTGHSHVDLNGTRRASVATEPPALPASVEQAAAQLAAAAAATPPAPSSSSAPAAAAVAAAAGHAAGSRATAAKPAAPPRGAATRGHRRAGHELHRAHRDDKHAATRGRKHPRHRKAAAHHPQARHRRIARGRSTRKTHKAPRHDR